MLSVICRRTKASLYFGVPGTNHGDAMNHGLPVADSFKPGGGLTMADYEADADKALTAVQRS